MDMTVGDELRLQAPKIAKRVQLQFPHSQFRVQDSLLNEVNRHVDFIVAALLMRRGVLYRDYVVWIISVMNARNWPLLELQSILAELRIAIAGLMHSSGPELLRLIDECSALANDNSSSGLELTGEVVCDLAKNYLELLLASRRADALELLTNALDHHVTLEYVYLQVLQPVMVEVGRLWQTNQITVAEEHYISAATQIIISQLYPRLLDGPRNGKVLVGASVASNLHEIGTRFVCDIFELRGWDTHYFGANTPTNDLLKAVLRKQPHVLAIGATLSSQLPAVEGLIKLVRGESSLKSLPIIVGGGAFRGHDDIWKDLAANGYAEDALSAVALANRLAGGS